MSNFQYPISICKKYLKIIKVFAKLSLTNQLAFRANFFLAIIAKFIRIGFLVVFFQAIYFNVESLAGWNYQESILLVLTFLTIESVVIITFHRNLFYYFPWNLRRGDFDFILTKPINPLFYSAFRVIDLMDLISFVFVIGLWIYYLLNFSINFSAINIILYLLFLANSVIFLFVLSVIIISSCFWIIIGEGLGRFFEGITRMARYPADIFKKSAYIISFYIFPIAIIATLPAKILLGKISLGYLIFGFCFTILLLIISLKFWKYALKHYSSTSS